MQLPGVSSGNLSIVTTHITLTVPIDIVPTDTIIMDIVTAIIIMVVDIVTVIITLMMETMATVMVIVMGKMVIGTTIITTEKLLLDEYGTQRLVELS